MAQSVDSNSLAAHFFATDSTVDYVVIATGNCARGRLLVLSNYITSGVAGGCNRLSVVISALRASEGLHSFALTARLSRNFGCVAVTQFISNNSLAAEFFTTDTAVDNFVITAISGASCINNVLNNYLTLSVTQRITFGCAADGAGLSGGAGCIVPLMTQRITFGCATDGAGLSGGAGCIVPLMAQCFALGCAADGAGLSGIAIGIHPGVIAGGGDIVVGVAVAADSTSICCVTLSTASGSGDYAIIIAVAGGIGIGILVVIAADGTSICCVTLSTASGSGDYAIIIAVAGCCYGLGLGAAATGASVGLHAFALTAGLGSDYALAPVVIAGSCDFFSIAVAAVTGVGLDTSFAAGGLLGDRLGVAVAGNIFLTADIALVVTIGIHINVIAGGRCVGIRNTIELGCIRAVVLSITIVSAGGIHNGRIDIPVVIMGTTQADVSGRTKTGLAKSGQIAQNGYRGDRRFIGVIGHLVQFRLTIARGCRIVGECSFTDKNLICRVIAVAGSINIAVSNQLAIHLQQCALQCLSRALGRGCKTNRLNSCCVKSAYVNAINRCPICQIIQIQAGSVCNFQFGIFLYNEFGTRKELKTLSKFCIAFQLVAGFIRTPDGDRHTVGDTHDIVFCIQTITA